MQKEVKVTICPPRYADGYIATGGTVLDPLDMTGSFRGWDDKTKGDKKKAVKGNKKGRK